MEHDFTGTLNIGSGQAVTLGSLAKKVAALLGADEGLLRFGAMEAPPNDPAVLLPDLTLMTRKLNWRPRWSLDQGSRNLLKILRGADRKLQFDRAEEILRVSKSRTKQYARFSFMMVLACATFAARLNLCRNSGRKADHKFEPLHRSEVDLRCIEL